MQTQMFEAEQFIPSLREALVKEPLARIDRLAVGIQDAGQPGQRPVIPQGIDRSAVFLTDGETACAWKVASLRSLFRGDKQPPVLGDHPVAYEWEFVILETHALNISSFFGYRPDAEMKEIFSTLRRRPDGRSLGFVHDSMWQAAALMLGTRPLSQAEFEAILGRLERSCRTFEMGPTSRNYIETLAATLGRGAEE